MHKSLHSVFAVMAGFVVGVLMLGCSTRGPIAVEDPSDRITFGVIGDLGCTPDEEPEVENVFADLNRDASLAFVRSRRRPLCAAV